MFLLLKLHADDIENTKKLVYLKWKIEMKENVIKQLPACVSAVKLRRHMPYLWFYF